MKTIYALHVEYSDAPEKELWLFDSLTEAEDHLREFAGDFLGGYTHYLGGALPADDELVAAFNTANAYPRIYRCVVDGASGDEVVPFAPTPAQA
jgi:hypothetical protein